MSSKKLEKIDKGSIGIVLASVAIAAMCFSYAFASPAVTYDENGTYQSNSRQSKINDPEYIKKTCEVYQPAIKKIEDERARAEAERLAQEQAKREAEEQAALEAQMQEELEQQLQQSYYDQYYSSDSYSNSYQPSYSTSGSFQSAGVIYDSNYRYTWYSSNSLYHYRTNEWTAGSDGIYRDSDGYVVVASSTHGQGTVIEDTPFGAAKVYDSGCASGTLDVYTNY